MIRHLCWVLKESEDIWGNRREGFPFRGIGMNKGSERLHRGIRAKGQSYESGALTGGIEWRLP